MGWERPACTQLPRGMFAFSGTSASIGGAGVLFRRDVRGVFVPLTLGSRALAILSVLVERPGELVSRAEIISAVWPETTVEESNLDVQIAALRRVLGEAQTERSCILTIRGAPDRDSAASAASGVTAAVKR
jgi:Transcriptional regulatory protein, C terminal